MITGLQSQNWLFKNKKLNKDIDNKIYFPRLVYSLFK